MGRYNEYKGYDVLTAFEQSMLHKMVMADRIALEVAKQKLCDMFSELHKQLATVNTPGEVVAHPVPEAVRPVQEAVRPVPEAVRPVPEAVQPVPEAVRPAKEPSVQEAVPPVQEVVRPAKEAVHPVPEAVRPAQEASVQEAVRLAQEPSVQEAVQPVPEAVPPVQEAVPPAQASPPKVTEDVTFHNCRAMFSSIKESDANVVPERDTTRLIAMLTHNWSSIVKVYASPEEVIHDRGIKSTAAVHNAMKKGSILAGQRFKMWDGLDDSLRGHYLLKHALP